ncbi:MAG: beta-galactosidase, partial [bacterium]|nr:beta-galactosidase [bacterium]
MRNLILITVAVALVFSLGCNEEVNKSRSVVTLEKGWRFIREDAAGGQMPGTDTSGWETVAVPHDWAIKGPFDKQIDIQVVRVTQDLEKEARERTGRTGALPHIGVGWYRKTFSLGEFEKGKKALLTFDGAMSDAHVFVNGKEVGNWPFGYNYFYFDITEYLKEGEN